MIYCNLTQGSVVGYFSDAGVEKNNKWYDPAIISISNFSYRLNGGYVKISDGELQLARTYLSSFTLTNRVFDIEIWYSATDTKLFKGKAIIIDDDEISVTFLLRTPEYENVLLTAAPDLGDLTERVYPRAFGKCRFVTPLLLDDTNLKYHDAFGTLGNVYDDGVSVSKTDNGDNTFTLAASPVGTITMDVNTSASSLATIASYVANELSISVNTTLGGTTVINYFANSQVNLLQFLSDLCEYHNHFFYIDNVSSSTTLHLIQKYLTYSSIPSSIKTTKASTEILKDGLGKQYHEIIKQYKASWNVRASVANPQRVQEDTANVVVNTSMETGQVVNIQPYDYYSSSITSVLNDKVTLYNLHEIELKLPDVVFSLTDIGDVIDISVPDYLDTTANNWMQIVELELDVENAETIVKGHGELHWS